MDRRFRKAERLQRRDEFRAVFDRRWSRGGKYIVLYGLPNDLSYNRLGLSVGRRFGNAVARNRFKRRCREVFRLTKDRQPKGWDFIIVPRLAKKQGKSPSPQPQPTFHELHDDFLTLSRRLAKLTQPHDDRR